MIKRRCNGAAKTGDAKNSKQNAVQVWDQESTESGGIQLILAAARPRDLQVAVAWSSRPCSLGLGTHVGDARAAHRLLCAIDTSRSPAPVSSAGLQRRRVHVRALCAVRTRRERAHTLRWFMRVRTMGGGRAHSPPMRAHPHRTRSNLGGS